MKGIFMILYSRFRNIENYIYENYDMDKVLERKIKSYKNMLYMLAFDKFPSQRKNKKIERRDK